MSIIIVDIKQAKFLSSWNRSLNLEAAAGLNAEQCGDQGVDVFAGVVERQRWADRGLEAEPAQDGLGAVVPGADRDSFLVERLADVLGAETVEDEGEDTRLLARGADQIAGRERLSSPLVA